jgi:hypothetical protein
MVKGRNTEYIGVRVPDTLANDLRSGARRRMMSFSEYLRIILVNGIRVADGSLRVVPSSQSGTPLDGIQTLSRVKSPNEVKQRYPGTGRNSPCPCGAKNPDGSPKKYKKCHGS